MQDALRQLQIYDGLPTTDGATASAVLANASQANKKSVSRPSTTWRLPARCWLSLALSGLWHTFWPQTTELDDDQTALEQTGQLPSNAQGARLSKRVKQQKRHHYPSGKSFAASIVHY